MAVCPEAFYCSNGSHGYSAINPAIHYLPASVALLSSSLSLMGATLSMIAYCAFKDLQKGTAQTIIAVLAMPDFLLALSCIFGASIHLIYSADGNKLSDKNCYNFDTLCQIQAFMTMWMLGCSFTWTSILALHFFLVTICTRSTWPHKLMPLYIVVGWLVPLVYTLSMLLFGKLGYTPHLTWSCFVRPNQSNSMIQWDILEMTTAVCMFVGYICVLFIVILKTRQRSNPARKVSLRMLTLLVAYLLLRVWGLAISLLALITTIICSNQNTQIIGFAFNTIVAVTDPGQGWVNCLLYIILSPELRKRMVQPFQQMWRKCIQRAAQSQQKQRKISSILENTTNSHTALAKRCNTTYGVTQTYISFPTEFQCSD